MKTMANDFIWPHWPPIHTHLPIPNEYWHTYRRVDNLLGAGGWVDVRIRRIAYALRTANET